MAELHVSYAPRTDVTPEAELGALANAYKFVLDCHAKKEAAPESRPNDTAERSRDDYSATTHYTG